MVNMNIFKKMIIAILIAIGIVPFLLVLPWIVLFISSYLTPDAPAPEITYGEFPFRLEYEINGDRIVIEDILTFEYDGAVRPGGTGLNYRKWKSKLKSGNERITLLNLRENGKKDSNGMQILELYFYYGNAEYYMGGGLDTAEKYQELDIIGYIYTMDNGVTGAGQFLSEDAYDKYKIKLISWDVGLPIQNSFTTTFSFGKCKVLYKHK